MNAFHRWFCRSGLWRKALESRILPWVLHEVDLGDDLLEIGPGPGLATDHLRLRTRRVTAVELDATLSLALRNRLRETNVNVVHADGAHLPFASSSFSAAVCFTMLHHVPSEALQDLLLREVCQVLRPGGVFAGSDSRWSRGLQLVHLHDTLVPVDPGSLPERLKAAGFVDIHVDAVPRAFRFRARRP